MANRPLAGSGPVPFTTADGAQFLVRLSELAIGSDGIVKPTAAVSKLLTEDADKTAFGALLAELVDRGTLWADTRSRAAMVFTAATAGRDGNKIIVTVENVREHETDPDKTKLDLKVVELCDFVDLSTDKDDTKRFVGTVLKDSRLVKLDGDVTASVLYPLAGKYGSTEDQLIVIDIPASAAGAIVGGAGSAAVPSFTLIDADDALGPVTQVEVVAPDATTKLFTLKVTRTTTEGGVTLGELLDDSATNPFAHAIQMKKADETKGPIAPAERTYVLSGGTDVDGAIEAQPASVIAFT